jgi:hypothetical protein
VVNTKAKTFSHENDSYVAVWVKDGEETKCLLFTDSEISRATHRADRNSEDLTERSWISKLID